MTYKILSPKLIEFHKGELSHWCPACDMRHIILTNDWEHSGPRWEWNGDVTKPTYSPSVKTEWKTKDTLICHFFMKEGKIQFLNDCTHDMASTIVDIPDYPFNEDGAPRIM